MSCSLNLRSVHRSRLTRRERNPPLQSNFSYKPVHRRDIYIMYIHVYSQKYQQHEMTIYWIFEKSNYTAILFTMQNGDLLFPVRNLSHWWQVDFNFKHHKSLAVVITDLNWIKLQRTSKISQEVHLLKVYFRPSAFWTSANRGAVVSA